MSDVETKRTVAIIGAGIVGVSTAIWCLRDGHNVILIDKKGPAEGASFGNGGVLASCAVVPVTGPGLLKKVPRMLLDPNQPLFLKWSYLPKLAPWLMRYLKHANADSARARAKAMTPIIGDSLADHQSLAAGTGAEKWVVPTEYLYAYKNRSKFDADAFGWNLRAENGFEWETLEGSALSDFDPCYSESVDFGVKMQNHGRISDPGAYVKALAVHAQEQGAKLIIAEVSDILSEHGKVTGLRAGGENIACDAVVLASGAWSGPLAKRLGVDVPLESERGYHLELYEPSVMPRTPVMIAEGKFVVTPMDGRLRLAGAVEFGGLDAPRSHQPFKLLERGIRSAIPGLTWKETRKWMGHRPSIADSLPLIGEAPDIKGAYLGFGHDHVGLTGGPKTGRLLSQMIGGRNPNIDLAPYSPARFGA